MAKTKKNYMAVDQYGNTFHDLGNHPRKALLAMLCRKASSNIYRDVFNQDTNAMEVKHVGYVIAGYWLELFEVSPMRKVRL